METEHTKEELVAEIEHLTKMKDSAYAERNRCVALLARVFPSGIRKTSIPGWDKVWDNCVYLDIPIGETWKQASWHYHDDERYLFSNLPPYERPYDGHTTKGKYRVLYDYCEQVDGQNRALTLWGVPNLSMVYGFIQGYLKGLPEDNGLDERELKKRIMPLAMQFSKGMCNPKNVNEMINASVKDYVANRDKKLQEIEK